MLVKALLSCPNCSSLCSSYHRGRYSAGSGAVPGAVLIGSAHGASGAITQPPSAPVTGGSSTAEDYQDRGVTGPYRDRAGSLDQQRERGSSLEQQRGRSYSAGRRQDGKQYQSFGGASASVSAPPKQPSAYAAELADWARYSRQGVLFRGLRVRMGVATGSAGEARVLCVIC